MNKVLLFVFMLVLASVAGAEPLCQNGNLGTYIVQGYACRIGDLVFSNFGYTPTGTSGSISAQSVAVGLGLEAGLAEVLEAYCLGDTQSNGCKDGRTGTLSQNLEFDPVKVISVSKDINVNSGSNGTANISQAINTFDHDVPKPVSLLLCGTGLFALGFLRRRK